MEKDKYCIDINYKINLNVVQRNRGYNNIIRSQKEVYRYARCVFCLSKSENILDIGCGCPEKLKMFIGFAKNIYGIDTEKVVSKIEKKYTFGKWFAKDLSKSEEIIFQKFDMILCADVIEHIEDPNVLVDFIKKQALSHTQIILSTPDRESLNNNDGPPLDMSHYREWKFDEFKEYILKSGFNIRKIFYDVNKYNKKTIVCHCKIN